MTENSTPSGISRRTLVKGAAWSVPVVAVGPALPAFAYTPPVLEFSGTACKIPGQGQDVNKGYVLGFSVNNRTGAPIRINVTDFVITGATSTITPLGVQFEDCSTNPLEIPGMPPYICFGTGETLIALYLQENGNSNNALLTLTYEVYSCDPSNTSDPGTLLQGETDISVQLSGDPTTGGCEPHPGWFTTRGCPLPGAPTISTILPASGPEGTVLTITGTNLLTADLVCFGSDVNLVCAAPTTTSFSELTVTVPAYSGPKPDLIPVGVTNAFGSVIVPNAWQILPTP